MKPFVFHAVGLVVALLPGCVSWNTGTRIREASLTYKGVDVSRPVGGVVYESRSDAAGCYMQAPEVTYRQRTPLVRIPVLEQGDAVSVADVRDTGRTRWVRQSVQMQKPVVLNVLETPPPDLAVHRIGEGGQTAPRAVEMGVADVVQDAGTSPWYYPCHYVVDPLLTVASTAVAIPAAAVGGSAYGLWTIFSFPVKKVVRAVLPDNAAQDTTPMPEAPVVMP